MTFNEWYEDWTQGQPMRDGARSVAKAAWDACEKNIQVLAAEAMEGWWCQHTGAAERALGPDEKPENSI